MNKCINSDIQELLPDLLHRTLADDARKRVERLPHSLLRLFGDQPIEGAIFTHVIRFFHGNCFPTPSLRPSSIQHQPPLDREKPCPQRARSSKRIKRCERPNERVLHQLFNPSRSPALAAKRARA